MGAGEPGAMARSALAALAIIAAMAAGGWAAPRQAASAQPAQLELPPAAQQAVQEIYAGDPDAALATAERMEKEQPDEPLGYLIEAEARWWRLYCGESEVRYGMVDFWRYSDGPERKPYLAAAQRAAALGEQEIQKRATAQAELWAGMGYALESRMYAAQGQKMATARTGVKARSHLLRAIALNPGLADANTGLGLYNYYVDTLSPIVKLLRIFLGIPGGSKREGIRQLRTAMERGQLTAVEARFYLARNLRTFDHDYAQALSVAEPLERDYPDNPIFGLLIGNLEMELGRKEQAEATLARIGQMKIPNAACAERSGELAKQLLGNR